MWDWRRRAKLRTGEHPIAIDSLAIRENLGAPLNPLRALRLDSATSKTSGMILRMSCSMEAYEVILTILI